MLHLSPKHLPLNMLAQHAQRSQSWQGWLPSRFQVEISYLLRRHAWTFVATTATALILAIAYIAVTPRIFTAHAQLFLDPRNLHPIGGEDKEMMQALDNPEVESQITILRSEQVLAAVAAELKLDADPEFVPVRDGTRAATTKQGKASASADMFTAIASLQDTLEVRRAGLSHTLDIYFRSVDAEKAASIANAVAEAFIKDQLVTRSRIASQGTTWLEERIDQLRRQVNEAVVKAAEFRAKRDYRIQQPPGTGGANAPPDQSPQITLDELESTASTYRKLYESYLQAYTNSVQRQALPSSMARVITRARPPLKPSHPRTLILFGVSILLGLLTGYGIALIRHLLDNSVRGPIQIQKAGLNCLGQLRGLKRPAYNDAGRGTGFAWTRHYFSADESEEPQHSIRMLVDDPLSQFGSDMRMLERNLTVMTTAKSPRQLGVAPAGPIEGTAELVINLAYLSAIKGKRVLVVDANLYSAPLTRAFAPDAHQGLVDVLSGNSKAHDSIVAKAIGEVDFLPAGAIDGATPWPVSAESLKNGLAPMLSTYDLVLFHLPDACNNPTAALSLSHVLNAVILVAEYGRTQLPLLSELSSAFQSANVEFVGVAVSMDTDAPRVRRSLTC